MGASRSENFIKHTTTIAADASVSSSWWADGVYVLAIDMPAVWTAADLTVQASMDNQVTWKDVYDTAGSEWLAKVGAGQFCLLRTDRPWLGGMCWLRFRSGTAASPVNQAAERTITVVCAYPNA